LKTNKPIVVQPNPDSFFRVELDFVPKIQVESGRVGPQGRKTGPLFDLNSKRFWPHSDYSALRPVLSYYYSSFEMLPETWHGDFLVNVVFFAI
jgi:hypothetical protein